MSKSNVLHRKPHELCFPVSLVAMNRNYSQLHVSTRLCSESFSCFFSLVLDSYLTGAISTRLKTCKVGGGLSSSCLWSYFSVRLSRVLWTLAALALLDSTQSQLGVPPNPTCVFPPCTTAVAWKLSKLVRLLSLSLISFPHQCSLLPVVQGLKTFFFSDVICGFGVSSERVNLACYFHFALSGSLS